MAKSPIINAVDEGHVARFSGKGTESPLSCKTCDEAWPCEVIVVARAKHRATMPTTSVPVKK